MKRSKFNDIKAYITNTWMCIKYPFLYPRNRFTGLHYNDWKLINKRKELYCKYSFLKYVDDISPEYKKTAWYYNEVGQFAKYWTNWWARPYIWLIDVYHDYILQLIHFPTDYTEYHSMLYEMPGWEKAFGKKLLKELRWQLIKDHLLFKFRITQWKEKYGGMELYCNYYSKGVSGIIEKYHYLSEITCIECGKPAEVVTSRYGWACPYCKDCYEKNHSGQVIEYTIDSDGGFHLTEEAEELEAKITEEYSKNK